MALNQARRSRQSTADCIDGSLLLQTLTRVKNGDFDVRMPGDETGLTGKVYDAVNDIVELNQRLAQELERVCVVVGKEGRIKERASVSNATGEWRTCTDSVNMLIGDLVQPTTEVARVIGAVAKGDLSETMALEIDGRPLTGEFLRTARTVNTMVKVDWFVKTQKGPILRWDILLLFGIKLDGRAHSSIQSPSNLCLALTDQYGPSESK